MAHGKHRRSRATTQRNPKMASFKARLREGLQVSVDELLRDVDTEAPTGRGPVADLAAKFMVQEHMLHDGDHADATEQVFNLMACVHPAQCTCETDYPNWRPGMR